MKYYTSLINNNQNNEIQSSNSTKIINGPRPSPLKINKGSHTIHKPSNYHHQQQQVTKPRQPVIIYTHSPKIIHTQARDFMALVQRLTGLSAGHVSSRNLRRRETCPESSSEAKSDNDSSTITAEDNADRPFNNIADIPLFTPSGMNLNLSSSLSPTVLEFMKGLPEY